MVEWRPVKEGGLRYPSCRRKPAGLKSGPESFTEWRREDGLGYTVGRAEGLIERRRVANLQLLFISD